MRPSERHEYDFNNFTVTVAPIESESSPINKESMQISQTTDDS